VSPRVFGSRAEEVRPGDVVQGVVLGKQIGAGRAVGCTFDRVVEDADAEVDGVQFALTVPAAFPAESDEDGTEQDSA
jgi:hypothetical protein